MAAPPLLTLALDGGEGSGSLPYLFVLAEKAPVAYCTGDWVSLCTGIDAVEQRKTLSPTGYFKKKFKKFVHLGSKWYYMRKVKVTNLWYMGKTLAYHWEGNGFETTASFVNRN
jgi:hypothetical protein